MNEAAKTLDGWYSLHLFYAIDFEKWRTLSADEQSTMINDFNAYLSSLEKVHEENKGSHAFYNITGQKADLMLWLLRPTMDELNALETKLNKLPISDYLIPTYSYVSVIELSNYLAKDSDEDPYENPYIKARLYPEVPRSPYVCFYPMDKRREGNDNWYMLDMAERRELMKSHGMIGRSYAGIVKQFITGSVGFDDYEWGVTLFSDDILQFKKLVYEMRFDEVSARYGEFGSFFVGTLLDDEKFKSLMHV